MKGWIIWTKWRPYPMPDGMPTIVDVRLGMPRPLAIFLAWYMNRRCQPRLLPKVVLRWLGSHIEYRTHRIEENG